MGIVIRKLQSFGILKFENFHKLLHYTFLYVISLILYTMILVNTTTNLLLYPGSNTYSGKRFKRVTAHFDYNELEVLIKLQTI